MTTYNVTNSSELDTAMNAAVAGDDINLANGTYTLNSTSRAKSYGAGKVTISANNKWQAIIDNSMSTSVYLSCDNAIFSGIKFSNSVYLNNADGCEWLQCQMPNLFSRFSDNCTVKYSHIGGWLQLENNGGVLNHAWLIECNLFRNLGLVTATDGMSNDQIHIQGGQDHVIIRNTLYDIWLDDFGDGTYTHTDHIQIANDAPGSDACPNIRIEDNWIYDSAATMDQVGSRWPIMINCNALSMTIKGNIISGVSANGLYVADLNGAGTVSENLTVGGPNTGAVTGGCPLRLKPGGNTNITVQNNVVASINNEISATANVSGNVTGVVGSSHFDWTSAGAEITDYVPVTSGTADVSGQWRTRLAAIIGGTEDFYDYDGTLYLAEATPAAPVITGTPSISGTENVGQTLTASAASVTGYPVPMRTWQWYNSASGAIAGATSASYTLQASDEGDTVYVIQTETNTEDVDTAQSSNSGTIGAALSAPSISTLSPANGATGVNIASDLVVTFDTNIQFGSSGTVTLWRAGAVRETWLVSGDPNTSHSLTIDGAVLTIDTQNNMLDDADYYVNIDAGAIESTTGAAFAGISDGTTWAYSTSDPLTTGRPVLASGGPILLLGGLPIVSS